MPCIFLLIVLKPWKYLLLSEQAPLQTCPAQSLALIQQQEGRTLQGCQAAPTPHLGELGTVSSMMGGLRAQEVCPHPATLAMKGMDAGSASKQERRGRGLT